MTTIDTIRGPIDTGRLGDTLMHEHVFVLNEEIEHNYPGRWDEEVRVGDAIAKLDAAYDAGVRTIVDLTVLGLGRRIERVARVAEQVRVNIVVATGLYTYGDVPLFFHFRGPGRLIDGPELLSEFFVRDLTEGIAGTGIKASVIKCATDAPGVTPGVERVLRAAAAAHRETGAPILTHSHALTERGAEQLRIFVEEGVDLERVVIGHSGDTTDLDYLRRLMDTGCYIGMDRFGIDLMLSPEERIDTVVRLCQLGYAERMVLSHDAAAYSHNWEIEVKERLMPNWNYTYIHREVLPALRSRGVSDADIRTMLVENPARLLVTR